jgi:polyisoprenyl-teichoic acid--peptidoglycan teichoic acid transferase
MRRRHSRLLPALGLFVATGSSVVVAGNYYVNSAPEAVATVPVGAGVLDVPLDDSSSNGPAENYLLVGTDSRDGADKADVDYGGIISGKTNAASAGGIARSDTMLVLRYDPKAKKGTLMSLPRDLRVLIADTNKRNKINSAFEREDPTTAIENLVKTVQNLGIPIQHFIEVDFNGFKEVVDAVGGVKVQFVRPTRDTHTGLDIPQADCITMDGVQSREYVRSRFLEIFVKGKWHTDGSSDIGRMARQQDFLQRALNQAIVKIASDPATLSRLLGAATSNMKTDPDLKLAKFAGGLRSMAKGALETHTLPNTPNGEDLVMLEKEAAPYIAFFRGETATIELPEAPAPAAAAAPATTVKGAKTTAATAPAEPDPLAEPFLPITDC